MTPATMPAMAPLVRPLLCDGDLVGEAPLVLLAVAVLLVLEEGAF